GRVRDRLTGAYMSAVWRVNDNCRQKLCQDIGVGFCFFLTDPDGQAGRRAAQLTTSHMNLLRGPVDQPEDRRVEQPLQVARVRYWLVLFGQ
ncbi:hypothetical protein, partial [Streptomyces sp. MMG1533]|uniref:hypothetical protein n=1 Tax=Streptomyces sp. MMG1533 TaxID=1415546 RepID=UPI001F339396